MIHTEQDDLQIVTEWTLFPPLSYKRMAKLQLHYVLKMFTAVN